MSQENRKANHLMNEKSPYLLQHAYNPVDWYPWCDEAFQRARAEDKPVFLSIGYSTCHWCHVMAHESFEDEDTAELLNGYFIAIKVDKEERPDIDSIYMSVCQAFTGSGGWPTSIFMTADQKPFFAGTYFPRDKHYGMITFQELLMAVKEKWYTDRYALLESAEEVVTALRENKSFTTKTEGAEELLQTAEGWYREHFDKKNGGFGSAPKFPTPHNLWFLLRRYQQTKDKTLLAIVEKTLIQVYRGGLFDHIGYGFSRYSTDPYFLVPHFEKMLYDNALLILVYSRIYQMTGKNIYLDIAEKTASYILREMTYKNGGFYCAQDADAEGEEGKYYLLEPNEILKILGTEEGEKFNRHFDITEKGNFEGKNIPNLLKNGEYHINLNSRSLVYEYRKKRYRLHLDDKILTSWNGLMVAALCCLYRVSRDERYLKAARSAQQFVEENLCENGTYFVSYREGRNNAKGFLDDYASQIWGLLCLYDANLEEHYQIRAYALCQKVISDFLDKEEGGFYLYGEEHEALIFQPKETYDGAMPSGNSVMAYNLIRLSAFVRDQELNQVKERHINYMKAEAAADPASHTMFLIALEDEWNPPEKIVVVTAEGGPNEEVGKLPFAAPLDAIVRILTEETEEYRIKNDAVTFYVCRNHSCLPPTNRLSVLRNKSANENTQNE